MIVIAKNLKSSRVLAHTPPGRGLLDRHRMYRSSGVACQILQTIHHNLLGVILRDLGRYFVRREDLGVPVMECDCVAVYIARHAEAADELRLTNGGKKRSTRRCVSRVDASPGGFEV